MSSSPDLDKRALAPTFGAGEMVEITDLHRLLVESVRDYAIFALDRTGHILSWNPGAERFNGYTAEEVIGRHFSIFYPEVDIAADKPGVELAIAERDGRFEEEGWRIRKSGECYWANVVITALRDPDGQLLGFAKVTRDLTERKEAQDRAIADTRRLVEVEAANRAKSEFLAAMSHELRTPLNAIGGYAQLLGMGLRGTVSAEQQQDLDRILRSQRHLLAIVNDLLSFSKLEAGRVEYDIEPVNLSEVIEAMMPMSVPDAVAKQLVFEQARCDRDVRVLADRARLEQIVLNLLSNSVKFTQAGGQVTVSCERQGRNVALSVSDNGPGIPADKLEVIFEPFVQLGRTHTSSHEGTGLGLPISRDLARGMGGDLFVESIPGERTTFTVVLPAPDTDQVASPLEKTT